jgi:hypothetical protein
VCRSQTCDHAVCSSPVRVLARVGLVMPVVFGIGDMALWYLAISGAAGCLPVRAAAAPAGGIGNLNTATEACRTKTVACSRVATAAGILARRSIETRATAGSVRGTARHATQHRETSFRHPRPQGECTAASVLCEHQVHHPIVHAIGRNSFCHLAAGHSCTAQYRHSRPVTICHLHQQRKSAAREAGRPVRVRRVFV